MSLALGFLAAVSWSLGWTAPPSCPDGPSIQRRAEELVGGRTSGQLRATGVVRHEGARWRADLEIRVGDSQTPRQLEAESCDALAEAVAVMLALALELAPPPRRPIEAPPPRPPRPPEPLSIAGGLESELGFTDGLLPGFARSVTVRAYLQIGPFRLWSGAGVLASDRLGPAATATELRLVQGELGLGVPIPLGRFELEPVLRLELGRLEAEGVGPELLDAALRRANHVGLGGDLGVAYRLAGPLWLRLRAGVRGHVGRHTVVLTNEGRLHRTEPLSLQMGLGLGLRFGGDAAGADDE